MPIKRRRQTFRTVIYNRLVPTTEKGGGLSDRQYGFLKTKSTVNAISTVMKIAVEANKSYEVVTLDVENVFNTAKWSKILGNVKALSKYDSPNILVEWIGTPYAYHVIDKNRRERNKQQVHLRSNSINLSRYNVLSESNQRAPP